MDKDMITKLAKSYYSPYMQGISDMKSDRVNDEVRDYIMNIISQRIEKQIGEMNLRENQSINRNHDTCKTISC